MIIAAAVLSSHGMESTLSSCHMRNMPSWRIYLHERPQYKQRALSCVYFPSMNNTTWESPCRASLRFFPGRAGMRRQDVSPPVPARHAVSAAAGSLSASAATWHSAKAVNVVANATPPAMPPTATRVMPVAPHRDAIPTATAASIAAFPAEISVVVVLLLIVRSLRYRSSPNAVAYGTPSNLDVAMVSVPRRGATLF